MEDELLIARAIKKIVKKIPGVNVVDITGHFYEAMDKFMSGIFDMVLIDICLRHDHLNGIDLCKRIRKKDLKIPVIIISSDRSFESLKKAFHAYANDYIKKPFDPKELFLRVSRWAIPPDQTIAPANLVYKNISYSPKKNEFFYNDKIIPLTKKNKALLLLFLKNSEELLTQNYLQEKLWGDYDTMTKNRNLRSNIQILRTALKKIKCYNWIVTVRGEGYILKKTNLHHEKNNSS
ncbi:response regulator transcription factor [Candidatus Pacearchaeota archaeon]|nr:response regulator transcription factor [Candidatus Pacearchaeota archaeon]